MNSLLLVAAVSAAFIFGNAAGACPAQPASLPAGSTYIASANCPNGDTYNTPTQHCHCWCHKGYICDPRTTAAPATTTTTKATTVAPTSSGGNCANPPVPSGSTYSPALNCPSGPTYNTATQHCHCWCHKGYICDPRTTAAPATTTTTKATTVAPTSSGGNCANPPIPSGSTWVASPNCANGPTYNTATTHCHCYCHKGYICDPRPTTTTSATTVGTTATTTTAGTTASTTVGTTAATTASTTAATTLVTTPTTVVTTPTVVTTAATTVATTAATTVATTAATTAVTAG